jgi:HlyD family secretion protein
MKKVYWRILALVVVLAVTGVLVYRKVAASQAQSTVSLRTATLTLGEVASTITGVGTMRSKQTATVNWQTSGKVEAVNVTIGQQVTAGDVLASLDPSSLSTNIIQAQADLINAQNNLEDLQTPNPLKIGEAEKTLTQAQAALDNLLNPTESAILKTEAAVTNAQAAVEDAQAAVDKLTYKRATSEQISLARYDLRVAEEKVLEAQERYDNTSGDPEVNSDKARALSSLSSAKTARDRALANLNWYTGKASTEEVSQANLKLALAENTLAEAQDTLDSLKNPTETDIAIARAKVEDAEEALADAHKGASEEELIIAQTRVTVALATLDQARLAAPFNGVITDMDVLEGDLVSQGTEAFRIHDLSLLFVDLSISEMDIQLVQLGQEATLTFDALPDMEYTGVVTKIGMAATISQGVVNYPVTVQITNADASIFPGMTAAVSIVVEKVENVLVVPNQALRTTNGQRTVTVLFEGQQISVPVTVGLTSDSVSEISSTQLREGDTVVVNTSTTTTGSSTNLQGLRNEFGPGGGGVMVAPGGDIFP